MKLTLYILLSLILVFMLSKSTSTMSFDVEAEQQELYTTRREPTVDELIEANFPEEKYLAKRVMNCESGGNPKAVNYNTNGTIDSGLFQINSVHAHLVDGDLESLFDPKVNIRVAKEVYERAGKSFEPWVCYWKYLI